MLKISLICTVRNERKSIEVLLRSILNQSRPPDEIIIVDERSTDGTTKLIESFIANGAPIRLIVINDTSIGRGRNVAIKNARYGYIACVDAGCRLDKDWLKNLLSPFEIDPKVDVVYGFYLSDPKTAFEECVAKFLFPRLHENVRYGMFQPSSACIAFKKECHQKVGGYPEWLNTGEDNLFNAKLKKNGFRFYFARNALMYWRPRSNPRKLFMQYYMYARGSVQSDTSPNIKHVAMIAYFSIKRTPSLFRKGKVEYLFYYPLIALTVPIGHFLGRITTKRDFLQKLPMGNKENRKLRVLILSHRFLPTIGGGEKHTYILSKYLVKRMYDVTVYTTNSLSNMDVISLNKTKGIQARRRTKPSLPLSESIEGIKVRRFDIKFRYWSLNWIPELFKELLIRVNEFDLVHAHGYHIFSSVVACYIAKRKSVPFILTAHDMAIPPTLPYTTKILKVFYDSTFGSFLIRNSTLLIALNEDQIKQFLSYGGKMGKIKVIPNALELDKYTEKMSYTSYCVSPSDKIILSVGRIEKYKGIEDVIEVMPQVLKKEPNTHFIVVGDDWGGRKELENLVKKLRLEDNVVFTGVLSEEETTSSYKRADIVVFPSKSEAFGIVILEAMASERLCIAYAIPCVRNIIRHGETGILVNNKVELLEKLLYFLRNEEAREKIAKRALANVKNYSADCMIKKIESAYKEALVNKPNRVKCTN